MYSSCVQVIVMLLLTTVNSPNLYTILFIFICCQKVKIPKSSWRSIYVRTWQGLGTSKKLTSKNEREKKRVITSAKVHIHLCVGGWGAPQRGGGGPRSANVWNHVESLAYRLYGFLIFKSLHVVSPSARVRHLNHEVAEQTFEDILWIMSALCYHFERKFPSCVGLLGRATAPTMPSIINTVVSCSQNYRLRFPSLQLRLWFVQVCKMSKIPTKCCFNCYVDRRLL